MSENILSFEDFVLMHKPQLHKSRVPKRFWYTLHEKLRKEIFDAGDSFMIQKIVLESSENNSEEHEQYSENQCKNKHESGEVFEWQVVVHTEDGIDAFDDKQIYLVDHAWTYRADEAKHYLRNVPGLLSRMTTLMDINEENKTQSQLIDGVFNEMWKFNQTYSVGNADFGTEGAMPIWYVMDEFGSRIQHSDEPTVKVLPFCYIPTQVTYSLLWPIQTLEYGEEITRDFVEGCQGSTEIRKIRLLPWQDEDYTHLSYQQKQPEIDFIMKYRQNESLPDENIPLPEFSLHKKFKVFTDVHLIKENLRPDSHFELTSNEDEADILWKRGHFFDFKTITENRPGCFINQFPFESILTVKDLMSAICHTTSCNPDTLETTPAWLQTTYNLETELPQFVSFFQHRKNSGLNNLWICKPWNLGRGLDLHVTDNLSYILRLPDSGPKLACKYITNPVLIEMDEAGGGLKFDLRYIVLLRSVKPLKLLLHKTFSIRMANKRFSLDDFEDFEKHFTVLNYKNVDISLISPNDFIKKFEKQNPNHKWAKVEDDILQCLRDLFVTMTSQPPPRGIAQCNQSRAIYGIDVMLKWYKDEKGLDQIQPVIIEANFIPDITRQIHYRTDFVNDVFYALFLDNLSDKPVITL